MMNIMNRYFTKFNTSIASVVSMVLVGFMAIKLMGIGKTLTTAAAGDDLENLTTIMSIASTIKSVYIVFLIVAVFALIILISSIFSYVHKKQKELCYIIYIMASAPMVYGALKVVFFVGQVKKFAGALMEGAASGDAATAMLGAAGEMFETGTALFEAVPLVGIIKYSVIGMILSGIYAIYVLYRYKTAPVFITDNLEKGQGDSSQNTENESLKEFAEALENGKAYAKEAGDAVSRKSKEVTESLSVKVRSMTKKQKRTVVGVIAAVAVCAAGFGIWDTFFNFDKVDVMEGMTAPTFAGYDGEGYMESGPEMGNIDYDRTTPGAEDFINSITYSVDKTDKLSNGDEVTITAEYSEKTAKALKIKVTSDTKTIKVSGLIERYKDGNDISKENLDLIKTAMDREAEEAAEYEYSYREEEYTYKQLALLYARDESSEAHAIGEPKNDTVLGVYQTVCGEDTEYFVVYSDTGIHSETDFTNLEYGSSSFESHFVYCISDYLHEDSNYTLTEIGADKKEIKTFQDWYESSVTAVAETVYPITVYPIDRPSRWEVIAEENTVIYQYSYDTEVDKGDLKEVEEALQELMEDEGEAFEKISGDLKQKSGIDKITLKVKFLDKNDKLLYETEF